MIIYGCIAGLLAGLLVLLIALLVPRKSCPNCGEKLPRFRKPQSGKQAMQSGWVCQNCGAEIDRSGKLTIEGTISASSGAQAALGTTRQCPRCAESIQMDALVCKYCGQEFSEADIKAAREQAEDQAQLERKAAQERADEIQKERQAKGRRNQGMVLAVVGWLLTIAGAILAIIFIFYAFSAEAQASGALAAIVPFLCTLPFIGLGLWLMILSKKRRGVLTVS